MNKEIIEISDNSSDSLEEPDFVQLLRTQRLVTGSSYEESAEQLYDSLEEECSDDILVPESPPLSAPGNMQAWSLESSITELCKRLPLAPGAHPLRLRLEEDTPREQSSGWIKVTPHSE